MYKKQYILKRKIDKTIEQISKDIDINKLIERKFFSDTVYYINNKNRLKVSIELSLFEKNSEMIKTSVIPKKERELELEKRKICDIKNCELCEYFGKRSYYNWMDTYRITNYCNLKKQDIGGTLSTSKECTDYKLNRDDNLCI